MTDRDAFTHVDDEGAAEMVGVGDKPETARRAVARGDVRLRPATADAVRDDGVAKGDVLAVARVAAVDAVKHTWEAVPLCHQIPVTDVGVTFDVGADRVTCEVAVEAVARTGPEMEALQGVTGGLATVWDMVKAAEKDEDGAYPETAIEGVRVVEKRSGPVEDDGGQTQREDRE